MYGELTISCPVVQAPAMTLPPADELPPVPPAPQAPVDHPFPHDDADAHSHPRSPTAAPKILPPQHVPRPVLMSSCASVYVNVTVEPNSTQHASGPFAFLVLLTSSWECFNGRNERSSAQSSQGCSCDTLQFVRLVGWSSRSPTTLVWIECQSSSMT
ncbi:hypothetical protein AOLI_G00250740 [Acnodon oligacanthus]